MSVLTAERIKLTTTRSPLWCTIIVIVLSLGLAAVIGWASKTSMSSTDRGGRFFIHVSDAVGGVSGFGVLVLMILAALAITTEYRFGTIRTTFQAIPNRASVLVTKAGLIGVFAAALTVVLAFIAYYIANIMAGSEAGARLHLETAADWRAIYGIPIYAFLCVVFAIGVGALVRQSAAAIAIVLLWPLLIESLFGLAGHIGREIQAFLPFMNAKHFLGGGAGPGGDVGVDFHWGPWGSLVYFAVIVAVIFGASIYVVNKRDA